MVRKCAKLFSRKAVNLNLSRNLVLTTTILVILNAASGCGDSPTLPAGAVGNPGTYNYSPSVMESGDTRKFWWCSPGINPNDPSQDTDAIYYESINMSTHKSSTPVLVLAETPGSWDSAFTCNPKVVGGVFENPLGDGQTYTYAMYYVATQWLSGDSNSIGVAFSTMASSGRSIRSRLSRPPPRLDTGLASQLFTMPIINPRFICFMKTRIQLHIT